MRLSYAGHMAGGSQHVVDGMTHYERNKTKYLEKTQAQRAAGRAYVAKVKAHAKCADCGINDWRVLDFDHLPGFTKRKGMAELANSGASISTIKAEMDKCEIVCANCHRIRSWQRKQAMPS